jgi:hypothetical protein
MARAVLVVPGDMDEAFDSGRCLAPGALVIGFGVLAQPYRGHPYRPEHRLYGQLADCQAPDQAGRVDVVGLEEFGSCRYGSIIPAEYSLASVFLGCA